MAHMGKMENKMETTILGLEFRVYDPMMYKVGSSLEDGWDHALDQTTAST